MSNRILAILSAALESHLAQESDFETKSKYACLAVSMAASRLYGSSARYSLDVEEIRARIRRYIGGLSNAEFYLEQEGIDTEPYQFRRKMLEDILAEYESARSLAEARRELEISKLKHYTPTHGKETV